MKRSDFLCFLVFISCFSCKQHPDPSTYEYTYIEEPADKTPPSEQLNPAQETEFNPNYKEYIFPTEKLGAEDSFEHFLYNFETDSSIDNWSDEAQLPLVMEAENIHGTNPDKLVLNLFKPIPAILHHFLRLEKLKTMDEYYPVPDPFASYNHMAFKKVDMGSFWIVSYFGFMKQQKDEEWHAHPFLLLTYTKAGEPIDNFLWWSIEDDVTQLWAEGQVHGDTILTGIDDSENGIFDRVYSKFKLGEDGRFVDTGWEWDEPENNF